MVVEETEVSTELAFSSPWATDAMLTTPKAASDTVHLFNVI
jgi:hypothetical protein